MKLCNLLMPGTLLAFCACDVRLEHEPRVIAAPMSTSTEIFEVAAQVPDSNKLDFKPSAVSGGGGFNSYVAYDDVRRGRVLAGGDVSGIWTSLDHGLTWWPTMEGLEDPGHRHIASIAVFNGDSYFAAGKSHAELAPPGDVRMGVCGESQPTSAIYRMARGSSTWERLSGVPVQFSGTEDDCISGNTLEITNVMGRLFTHKPAMRVVFAGTYKRGVVAVVPTCGFNGLDDDRDGLVDEVDEEGCADAQRFKIVSVVIGDTGLPLLEGKRITSLIPEDDESPTSMRLLASYRNEANTAGGVMRFSVSKRVFNNKWGALRPTELRAFNIEVVDSAVLSWLETNSNYPVTDYSPEELAMYRGEVYIAANNAGVYRCNLRGRGSCVPIVGPSPFFQNGIRRGPHWSTVGTRRNASGEDEIWFGARAWPELKAADETENVRAWNQMLRLGEPHGIRLDNNRPPKLYTTLVRLRLGLLRDMAQPSALSTRVADASGPNWWRIDELLHGIPASDCVDTAPPRAPDHDDLTWQGLVDSAADCRIAKAADTKMRERLENIDYIAFNPFIASRMMVTPLRRSDDRGTTWYYSNRQANGVVGHRVRYDESTGTTYASMHDHGHVESTTDLETVILPPVRNAQGQIVEPAKEVTSIRWNRVRHGTGNASAFTFARGFVFIGAQPQRANREQFPEIWAQRPGGGSFTRPLRRTWRPAEVRNPGRWATEIHDVGVGCGASAEECESGVGWRLMTVLSQVPGEQSSTSEPSIVRTPFSVLSYVANPEIGMTVTIDTQTFVFVTSGAETSPGQVPVVIGASADETFENLVARINQWTPSTRVSASLDSTENQVFFTLSSGNPKELWAFGTTLAGAKLCGAFKPGKKTWIDCQVNLLLSCSLQFNDDTVDCAGSWSTLDIQASAEMLTTPDDRLAFFWPGGAPRPYLWNRWSGLWTESAAGPDQPWTRVPFKTKGGGTGTGHARLSKKVPNRLYYTDHTGVVIVDGIDTSAPTTTCVPIPGMSECRPTTTPTRDRDGPDRMATALAVGDDDVIFVAVRDDVGGPPTLWRIHLGGLVAPEGPRPSWEDVTDTVYRSVALNVEDLDMGPDGKLFVTPTGSGFLVGTPR